MNNYNPLMPKNKIYIIKKDREVYKIMGNKEDELPIRMIAVAMGNIGKGKINSKDLESAIKRVCDAGEQK
jgi:nitrogen regulatory protein PII